MDKHTNVNQTTHNDEEIGNKEHNEDKKSYPDFNGQVVTAIKEMSDNNGKRLCSINKRIDFDRNTFLRLEMMVPLYKQEIEGNPSENEVISHIIKIAVNSLFEEEFKKKIAEL